MTRREQIIEILKTWDDYIFGGDINENIADAILALPFDMPSDAQVEDKATLYSTEEGGEDIGQMLSQPDLMAFYDGAKWAIDEIKKRNK